MSHPFAIQLYIPYALLDDCKEHIDAIREKVECHYLANEEKRVQAKEKVKNDRRLKTEQHRLKKLLNSRTKGLKFYLDQTIHQYFEPSENGDFVTVNDIAARLALWLDENGLEYKKSWNNVIIREHLSPALRVEGLPDRAAGKVFGLKEKSHANQDS